MEAEWGWIYLRIPNISQIPIVFGNIWVLWINLGPFNLNPNNIIFPLTHSLIRTKSGNSEQTLNKFSCNCLPQSMSITFLPFQPIPPCLGSRLSYHQHLSLSWSSHSSSLPFLHHSPFLPLSCSNPHVKHSRKLCVLTVLAPGIWNLQCEPQGGIRGEIKGRRKHTQITLW